MEYQIGFKGYKGQCNGLLIPNLDNRGQLTSNLLIVTIVCIINSAILLSVVIFLACRKCRLKSTSVDLSVTWWSLAGVYEFIHCSEYILIATTSTCSCNETVSSCGYKSEWFVVRMPNIYVLYNHGTFSVTVAILGLCLHKLQHLATNSYLLIRGMAAPFVNLIQQFLFI